MKSDIFIRPIITEKSMAAAARNQFTFEVVVTANKNAIATEAERLFKVTPLAVKTITIPEKTKRDRRSGRLIVERKRKKAIIVLPKGQKIALFDVAETTASPEGEINKNENKGGKENA